VPVSLTEVKAQGRKLPAKSQEEIQKLFFENDPTGNKRKALQEVSGDDAIEPTPENFRKYMSMQRAGGVSSLARRKAFQEALKTAMQPDEELPIDLRNGHGFEQETKHLPVLMSLAEIAIAHPRGQGWWRTIRNLYSFRLEHGRRQLKPILLAQAGGESNFCH
jgi:hypothetical protein